MSAAGGGRDVGLSNAERRLLKQFLAWLRDDDVSLCVQTPKRGWVPLGDSAAQVLDALLSESTRTNTASRPEYLVLHSHPEGLILPPDMRDQLRASKNILGIEECATYSLQPDYFAGYTLDARPSNRPVTFLLWGMRDRYGVAPAGVDVIECGGYQDTSEYCRHKRPHALRRTDGSEYTLWLDLDKAPVPEDGEPLPRYVAWPRRDDPWGVFDRHANRYVQTAATPEVAEEVAQAWNSGTPLPV